MANYLYATAGIQRTQKMPLGISLFAKVDGQISDQPLIDNEQYTAGGMESVRGYMESEAAGDNSLHGTLEVVFPDPLDKLKIGRWFQASPYLFYDFAGLRIKDPLPGQQSSIRLDGAGAGVRGSITKNAEYELDWAMAMHSTDQTKRYDQMVHFKVKALL